MPSDPRSYSPSPDAFIAPPRADPTAAPVNLRLGRAGDLDRMPRGTDTRRMPTGGWRPTGAHGRSASEDRGLLGDRTRRPDRSTRRGQSFETIWAISSPASVGLAPTNAPASR